MQLDGLTIAVTGANGNLGRAIVTKALQNGANVKLLDLAFDTVYQAGLPSSASCHVVDLLDPSSTNAIVSSLEQLDGLCNAAGGFAMGAATHETSEQDWSHMFKLNLHTMLNMCRAVVPSMMAVGRGRIVNIGAAGAISGAALMAPYVASKAAVMRTTESMAEELKSSGINVNCVMPSVIDTPQNREGMPDADYSDWVSPDQLANTISFLLSDEASGVHGACIPVKNLA